MSTPDSLPGGHMRLSALLPPQAVITRVSWCTMQEWSPPMADTARCCLPGAWGSFTSGSVPVSWACFRLRWLRNIPHLPPAMAPQRSRAWSSMFSGSLVAIVTPMLGDGAIDHEAWERLLDFHARSGTSGVVVGGSTGESVALSDGELDGLLARARRRLGGRIPVLAGVGRSCPARVGEPVRRLAEAPPHGPLVGTPASHPATHAGPCRHFLPHVPAGSTP